MQVVMAVVVLVDQDLPLQTLLQQVLLILVGVVVAGLMEHPQQRVALAVQA